MEKHIVEVNGLSYTLEEDGLYYPDLKLPEDTNYPIGRYGRMRKMYLKEHRKSFYMSLILEGRLNQHLHEIEQECYLRLDKIMEQMKVREGVTEQFKAENQMLWVGKMNSIKACAEEVILAELIYR